MQPNLCSTLDSARHRGTSESEKESRQYTVEGTNLDRRGTAVNHPPAHRHDAQRHHHGFMHNHFAASRGACGSVLSRLQLQEPIPDVFR